MVGFLVKSIGALKYYIILAQSTPILLYEIENELKKSVVAVTLV